MKKFSLLLLISSFLFLILASSALATTWYVSPSGSDSNAGNTQSAPFKTINSAEAAAVSGDEIHVKQGTYSLTAPGTITLKSGVYLRGGYDVTWTTIGTPGATVIDGGNSVQCMSGSGLNSATTIENFTIKKGYASNLVMAAAGLTLYDSNPTVKSCIFDSNKAYNQGGGMYNSNSSPTITNCMFISNYGEWNGGAMVNTNSSSPYISNCTFTLNDKNQWSMCGGIYNTNSSNPIIVNSILYGDYGVSIFDVVPCHSTVNYSCISGWGGTNIDVNPLFVNAAAGNVHLISTSECVNAGTGNASTLGLGWQQGYGTNPDGINGDSGIVDMGYHYSGYRQLAPGTPFQPSNFFGTAESISSIRWSWSDVTGEAGYLLQDQYNNVIYNLPANTTSTLEIGLAPHAAYIRHVHAYNVNGTSEASSPYSIILGTMTWYVDSVSPEGGSGTQASPFKTINSAEAAARNGDEIHVRQGIYSLTAPGTGTITLTSEVYLRGGYDGSWNQTGDRSTTVISGESSVRCMSGNSLTAATTIENLTIQNGGGSLTNGAGIYLYQSSPTITNCAFTLNRADQRQGGGIGLDSSSPTITNCTFTSNSASDGGGIGGIYNSSPSSPTISNCTFTSNSASNGGGIFNYYTTSSYITNCTFSSNTGGGIYNNYGSSRITNCTFTSNSGNGGILNNTTTSSTIENCTFTSNSGSQAGGIYYNQCSSPTIKNCVFTLNNATSYGGGISNYYSSLHITNCTFTLNSAPQGGGIYNYYNYATSPTINNSIIYGNSAGNIYNDSYSNPAVTYSCIEGGYTGTGNITWEPLFVNASAGDIHLYSISPCLNTGTGDAYALGLGWQQGYGSTPGGVYGDTGVVNMGYHYSGYTNSGPTNFLGTAESASSIRWFWSNVSDEAGYYLQDEVHGLKGATTVDVTNTLEAGLSANTRYTRHIHAYNAVCTSEASNIYLRYSSIEAATGVEFGTITTKEITARPTGTFSNLTADSSGIVTFNITQGTSSEWVQNTDFWGYTLPYPPFPNYLSPNTRYGFNANSRNGDGVANASTEVSYKYTLAKVPSTPYFGAVTTSSEVISWTANGNGGTPTYEVAHSADGATWESIPVYTGTATTCTNSSLGGNTKHYYKVRAENGDGVYTNYVNSSPTFEYTYANIPGKPTVIGGYDADNGYHTHITIEANGNPDYTEYAIWSALPLPSGWLKGDGFLDPTNSTWKTKADWETDHVNASIGLSSNTQYWYQVRARNKANVETVNSASGTAWTPSGPTPSVPTGLTTTQVGTYSAYSTWETVPTATSYTISYGIDTNASNIGITTETATHHNWTGLAPATTYYWKVLATNTYGPGAYSSIASFETETLPLSPSAPTGLTTTSITTNTAYSTWEVPSGSPTSYTISYGIDTNASNIGITTETATHHNWTGLAPATTYYWKVLAINSYGPGAYSSIASFETGTLPLSPSAPTGLTTTSITTNSAYSTWETPSGSPTSYTISYGIDTNASNIGITTEAAAAHSWTGLNPATKYYWKVSASNQYGTSEYSSIAFFNTSSLPPAAPPLVTVEAPNGGQTLTGGVTYEIRWSATAESAIKSNGITLRYSTDSGSSWNMINGGLPNTGIYSWEVATVNSPHCRVSVEAEDLDGNIGADMSDSDFTISTEGVSAMAPTIEAVRVNGISFRSGDVISSNGTLEAVISSEAGVNPTLTLLKVDYVPITPPLYLVSGNTNYGTWRGTYTITPGSQQVHIFAFHLVDMAANASDITMEAIVMGGGVQVIGTPNNYPNPFSPMSGGTTNIQYTLSKDATITIIIYDISGHEVKRMKFGSGTGGGRGGTNQVGWNGKSLGGEVVGNGIYFYKIISGNTVIGSGKLVIFD